jgi:energy-coupling factor transport system permease protein
MNSLTLFVPGNSLIYRLDPRTKLAGVALVFLLILTFNDPLYLLTVLICSLVAVASAGRSAFSLVGYAYALIPVLGATVLLWPFFEKSGETVLQFWWIRITDNGLLFAAAMGLRIVVPIVATLGLFLTTRRRDIITGLVRVGLPYQAGFGITIAFGLVPMLVGTAHTIVEAQRARGLDVSSGGIISRLIKSSSLIVPLMIAAIASIQNLALSMDSRAYGASSSRTYLHEPTMSALDRILVCASAAIFVAAVVARLFGYGALFPGRL